MSIKNVPIVDTIGTYFVNIIIFIKFKFRNKLLNYFIKEYQDK